MDPENSSFAGVALPATEGIDPRYLGLEEWPSNVALDALLEAQLSAVAAIRPALPAIAAAAEAAAHRLRQNGRLIYAGAGTSGRIGVQDGAELPPTFDWPEERLGLLIAGGTPALTRAIENAEDRTDLATLDMEAQHPTPNDVVIALAASGATPYAIVCLAHAREKGALTIGIANSENAPLLAVADHPILIQTGPEPIAGSTRLKAGTSQKIVLNLLSTLIMLRLGRVYRGQMVDMVARNEKLRRRALRMVRHLTGCTEDAARYALIQAGGRTKLAILLLHGLEADEAGARLAACQGQLGAVLRGLPNPAATKI
jgi:N-acetylmuramic acid 6-phosphate etherase